MFSYFIERHSLEKRNSFLTNRIKRNTNRFPSSMKSSISERALKYCCCLPAGLYRWIYNRQCFFHRIRGLKIHRVSVYACTWVSLCVQAHCVDFISWSTVASESALDPSQAGEVSFLILNFVVRASNSL